MFQAGLKQHTDSVHLKKRINCQDCDYSVSPNNYSGMRMKKHIEVQHPNHSL